MRRQLITALAVVLLGMASAAAQDAQTKAPSGRAAPIPAADAGHDKSQPAPLRQLPPDQSKAFELSLPGRTLTFTATAGSIPFRAGDGRLLAELGYVAYILDGTDPVRRPVTFAFNGGPGSASAWVHIGGFGPWRLPLEGAGLAPSANPVLLPNAETWLDFTDLVFLDPASTGFSRLARMTTEGGGRGASNNRDGGGPGFFHSVEGDAAATAEMIERWLRRHGRLASPKFITGESYGGIRAPKTAALLNTQIGVGVNGLILISPVLDFGLFRVPRHHPTMFVNALPTIAAAAREAAGKGVADRRELAEVEAYARGEYLLDLMRGPRDQAAVDRMVKRVAVYAGLSEAVVRSYGARIDEGIYLREANRPSGQTASGYDATVRGDEADPTAPFPTWSDPFTSALAAPMRSAMLQLYERIGIKTELDYHLSSREAFSNWFWGSGNSRPESFTQLRAALALDPRLQVLVTHGFTDLRTPYFASALVLDQLPTFANGRVALQVYPGGHMHYSRQASRIALRQDVKALIERALAADPSRP
jgi:carboxypeptidase C (cathepsin A)